MRSLLGLEAFAPIADELRSVSEKLLESSTVSILIPSSLTGVVASAILEAAMLDAEIPYRRRFSPRQVSPPCIIISEDIISERELDPSIDSISLDLAPLFSVGLRGLDGEPKRGVLSPVSQVAGLAELVAPDGKRTRRLRPFLLAGNWWADSIDQGYDPIYSTLLNHLREEGSIRVLPLPEVETPDLSELSGLDKEREVSTRETWSVLDADSKAEAMSKLVLPLVIAEKISITRLEELVWRRIKISHSDRDLHSILVEIQNRFDGTQSSINVLIEQLIANSY
ncbi:MAG: hypothetical protein CMA77_03565 [Euryarchaeota archaeon]|nr:hypothetical protein [Euryarchaeota archaeon]